MTLDMIGALKNRFRGAMLGLAVGDENELHSAIECIASGSFKKKQPPEIRGTGYVVDALEAALWAFYTTDSFRDGCLKAANLGGDADTTAAIYGQIAGAYYGADTRFDRLMSWFTHYSHFSRPLSGGLRVSQSVYGDAIQELRGRAAADGLSPCDWLAENFSTFAGWLTTESRRRTAESLRNADVNHCQAVYRLKTSVEKIRAILEPKPDLHETEPPVGAKLPEPLFYYDWLRLGESKQLERKLPAMFASSDDGTMVGSVGSLWLYEDRIVVESLSRIRFGFAREMIEKWLRNQIEFSQEGVVDLGSQYASRQQSDERELRETSDPSSEKLMFGSWLIDSDPDQELPKGGKLPPEIEAEVLTKVYRHHYENFIADEIPALDGMTPMEASRDAMMRPRLIELMKSHVHNVEQQAQEKGIDINIDWVLERLGLQELLD